MKLEFDYMLNDIAKTIQNYVKASEIFNNENKEYKIEVFQDVQFLHLYVHDLTDQRYEELVILNNCITHLSIKNLVKAYYELVDYLFEKWK